MMKKIIFWIRNAMIPHNQTKKEFFRDMIITLSLLGAAALLCALLNMFGSLLDILLGYSGNSAEIIGLVNSLCHETQL